MKIRKKADKHKILIHVSNTNGKPTFLRELRGFVESELINQNITNDVIIAIKVIFDEIIQNAAVHAYVFNQKNKIDIQLLFQEKSITLIVNDLGNSGWIKHYKFPYFDDVELNKLPDKIKQLGLYLVAFYADELKFYPNKQGGTCVSAVKFL